MSRPNKPRDLKVRRATRRDAAAVADLAREHHLEEGDRPGSLTAAAIRRDFLGRKPLGVILYAELDGNPAGYVLLTAAYDAARATRGFQINALHVTAAARKRSVWPVLLAVAAAETKRRDGDFMVWTSRAWNVAAQEFYRKQRASEEPVMSHGLMGKNFDAAAAEGAAFLKRTEKS